MRFILHAINCYLICFCVISQAKSTNYFITCYLTPLFNILLNISLLYWMHIWSTLNIGHASGDWNSVEQKLFLQYSRESTTLQMFIFRKWHYSICHCAKKSSEVFGTLFWWRNCCGIIILIRHVFHKAETAFVAIVVWCQVEHRQTFYSSIISRFCFADNWIWLWTLGFSFECIT